VKLLWVKSDFLHPTSRGGQIRTLEMVRRLHRRHDVHYVAFDDQGQPEGVRRSAEYCTRAYPIRHRIAPKGTPEFYTELVANLVSPAPAAIARLKSAEMRRTVSELMRREKFGAVVCDFLTPSINIPDLTGCILFQHNVETMIWQRRAQHAAGLAKPYLTLQARRMLRYEKRVCRTVRRVIAVSQADAESMQQMFGLKDVPHVPTGVDVEALAPPAVRPPAVADLIFVGSMDWMPNIDAVERFVVEILPLIRRHKPDCSLAIVGRTPPRPIQLLAEKDRLITVTGTVPDVRPYLWGSLVSIVPLRIGGGTRLKIYEAMAARVPVVSTSIGAEGLDVHHPSDIRIADAAGDFAAQCVDLLTAPETRERMSAAAWELVSTRFSWDHVVDRFERLIE
jgi:glycosyltransferase involved in cell wall biosynthesis